MHELLAPAGSFAAMEAATKAGADAVYLGSSRHNARLHGENFTDETLSDAVKYCHVRHKKVYLTLNTLLTDRELQEMPEYAHFLSETGIDGVIVQDIGLASLLREAVPSLPLHASTQMTVHNSLGIERAKELGFCRVVLSRESFSPDLIRSSPLEIEVFIHGALCISYSGQCYFSSMLAKRSGNRGTCAQPCRHKYKNGYDLSLHDLCLAEHIPALLSMPIASLKIEGRLKSPDYVGGVVSTYRTLLDEGRSATKEEMEFLRSLFSRQGFTDGYFLEKPGRHMFGFRTEADKKASQNVSVSLSETHVPLSMDIRISEGAPSVLMVSDGVYSARVEGAVPEKAASRPITEADCEKALSKLGGTPYSAHITASVDPDLFLPAAALNALRRDGVSALEAASIQQYEYKTPSLKIENKPAKKAETHCIFQSPLQIPENLDADFIWLPLFAIEEPMGENVGAILPTIVFDKEMEPVREKLALLKTFGIKKVMCHTIGQSTLCREMGFLPYGGTGLHIFNGHTAALSDMEGVTASPELLASQIRSMPKPLPLSVLVYGRVTLMTMENCLASVHTTCHGGKDVYPLTDEKGNVFPVLCAYPHRNEVLNARPLYMADKMDVFEGAGISAFLFRFTTETKKEVEEILSLYKMRAPAPFPFTRGCFFQKETAKEKLAPRRK